MSHLLHPLNLSAARLVAAGRRKPGVWTLACLAWAVAGIGTAGAAHAQTAPAPSAQPSTGAQPAPAEEAVRAAFGVVLQAAQELLRAGNAPAALGKLQELEKLPDRTPFENFTLNRVRGTVALVARDNDVARRSLEAVVNDARLKPADRLTILQSLTGVSQRMGDHAAAVRFAREFFRAGGQGDAMRSALVRSLFSVKDWTATVKEVQPLVESLESQGQKPAEELLKIWATCQLELKDEAGYLLPIEALVRHYPAPEYWGDLLSRIQRKPGFADRLLLDAYRLMRRTESIEDEGEYMSLAQLAVLAALPAEAQAVLEEGFKAGVLGKGPKANQHRDLRARVAKASADDKAQLAASEAQVVKAGDAQRLFAIGEAYLSHGDTEKGLALMDRAITQGIARNAGDARLRYGAALLQAGKRAQAETVLKGVQGSDGLSDLARLWLLAVR